MGLQLLDRIPWNVCYRMLYSFQQPDRPNSFPLGIPAGTAVPQWALQDVTVCLICISHLLMLSRCSAVLH